MTGATAVAARCGDGTRAAFRYRALRRSALRCSALRCGALRCRARRTWRSRRIARRRIDRKHGRDSLGLGHARHVDGGHAWRRRVRRSTSTRLGRGRRSGRCCGLLEARGRRDWRCVMRSGRRSGTTIRAIGRCFGLGGRRYHRGLRRRLTVVRGRRRRSRGTGVGERRAVGRPANDVTNESCGIDDAKTVLEELDGEPGGFDRFAPQRASRLKRRLPLRRLDNPLLRGPRRIPG